MKFIQSILCSLALLGLTFSAGAGGSELVSTNTSSIHLTATTNLLSPGVFYAGLSSDITFQPVCTFTNVSTNTFVFDASANGAVWIPRLITIVVTNSPGTVTTNICSQMVTNLPAAQRYPFWRVWVENPTVYATASPKVVTFLKTGL